MSKVDNGAFWNRVIIDQVNNGRKRIKANTKDITLSKKASFFDCMWAEREAVMDARNRARANHYHTFRPVLTLTEGPVFFDNVSRSRFWFGG